jgi:hypothetical protein
MGSTLRYFCLDARDSDIVPFLEHDGTRISPQFSGQTPLVKMSSFFQEEPIRFS